MPNIMIIDDEDLIRKGIVSIIKRLAPQWQVSESVDAISALESLENIHTDLMLIDINMPGIDGLELAKRLKLNYPHVLKIILTGHDKFSYVQSALRADALDYLLKPVIREELIGALAKAELVLEQRTQKLEQEMLAKQLYLEKVLVSRFSGEKIDEVDLEPLLRDMGWSLTGHAYSVLILIGEQKGFYLNKRNLPESIELFKQQFKEVADCFGFFNIKESISFLGFSLFKGFPFLNFLVN